MKPLDPSCGLLGLRGGRAVAPRPVAPPSARRDAAAAFARPDDPAPRPQTPALDPAVRATWPTKPAEPPPVPEVPAVAPSTLVAVTPSQPPGDTATRPLRVLKLLRILEASPEGETVDELARALDVCRRTILRDVDVLAEADEPVFATGPIGAAGTRLVIERDTRRRRPR